ncbi:MAG: oxidoreductase family protein [Flavobacteriales bacterium]
MNSDFKSYLLKITQSESCEEIEVIQSLWSGYGKIVRYELDNDSDKTVVAKNILLKQATAHPRGWNTNNSHNRKVKSYQVETNWYENWNDLCNENCRTPKFLGSFSQEQNQWILLEDLDTNFPLRKQNISISEVKACLKWLANFHGWFLSQKPTGLWEIGTYWNLETRPDEFEKIENIELKSKVHLIDEALNDCKYQTILHGDAKVANFCFSNRCKKVAAVDFQYVGGGCGMKDVAYFLGSCLSSSELETHEKELLDFYFLELKKAIQLDIDFNELEKEWRELYPFACTDFTRFLLGWMPSHQKVNEYNLKMMKSVLGSL